tara:strand:+ start:377 stop:664 length:288 start_codon:yes stop_codon:yes gene_type:complete
MTKKVTPNTLVKRLIKQISGNLSEEDELLPEVAIDGNGEIWCYDPVNKIHKKLYRGVKAFILAENYDYQGRTLIYTMGGDMVCIEPEEIIHTGYD